ncbi:MAG: hypothetical protein KGJ59_06120 [Bacteroidota bacterium]|nr:hypothetical protein [Bacteroidota bacterium]
MKSVYFSSRGCSARLYCIAAAFVVIAMLSMEGCSTSSLGISLFSTTIKVSDASGKPLVGAVVTTNTGERLTVDASGEVKLHFGGIGAYSATVMYQNQLIASYNINIPSDQGKTFSAQFVPPATPSVNGGMAVSAGASTGASAGVSASGGAAAQPAPSPMASAAMYPVLFQYLFSAYGYNVDIAQYAPGQWTDWSIATDNGEKAMEIRKAFLKRMDNGAEWWQLGMNADKDKLIMEVMFSAKRESLRRMRQKFGDEAPHEVPVTEGWYTSPMQLTPESVEGSVVQHGVSVTVPAGTFKTDVMEFSAAPGLTLRIWRSSSVPGGVVKYAMESSDKEIYAVTLKSYGDGAKTELGSY